LVTEDALRAAGREAKSNESTPQRLNLVSLVRPENHAGRDKILVKLKSNSVRLENDPAKIQESGFLKRV